VTCREERFYEAAGDGDEAVADPWLSLQRALAGPAGSNWEAGFATTQLAAKQ
jgi:hypothetical protein